MHGIEVEEKETVKDKEEKDEKKNGEEEEKEDEEEKCQGIMSVYTTEQQPWPYNNKVR